VARGVAAAAADATMMTAVDGKHYLCLIISQKASGDIIHPVLFLFI
jgi:hypothetical protein